MSTASQDPARLSPASASARIGADAPRVDVRSQSELAAAVSEESLPVVVAGGAYSVSSGVVVEVRAPAQVVATGDARVLLYDRSVATAADDAYVEARDRSEVTLYGRARARMYDQSSGWSLAASDANAFHDGRVRHSSDVRVWLHDQALLESYAPGVVVAADYSDLVLHGAGWQSRAEVSDRASVSLDGAAEVVASGHSFVHLSSGRVIASGHAIVTSDYPDDEPRIVRASEQAVVVADPGIDAQGPRVLTREQGIEVNTWLQVWGLEPVDGSVQLYVPVHAGTEQVFADGWRNQPPLVVGALVPNGLPVVAVPALRGDRGRNGLALRAVRVPVGALEPSSQLYEYDRAYAGAGVVVA